MKRFIVKTNVLDEHMCEPSFAYVELSDKDLEDIAKLIDEVKRLDKQFSIYSLQRFDYTPQFFDTIKDDDLYQQLCDDQIVEVEEWDENSVQLCRMDFAIMAIVEDGVYWHGTPKHCNYTVETPRLTIAMLFSEEEETKSALPTV